MTRRSLVELGAGLLLMAALIAVAARFGGSRGTLVPGGRETFEVSRVGRPEPAPAFRLVDLQGRPVRLEEYRGRVVLLNFWATWCAPCREEIPSLEQLSRELSARGLAVVAINYQEGPALVKSFVGEFGLTVPVLLDQAGGVGERYRVTALPASFFIDRRGALVGAALGFRDWSGPPARAYLADLLAAGS